ncbi:GNAT family N-acetyltransferase [Anaerorhabdus sp.]|jgi:ribosomal protein S18 acetylase RimI-like enzyme|uniref:GNAT family N-acetyltransferase n=1 Tax=Anaerorhabdus sp. TaxID=1872524 RepID=UPI002FCA056C
MYSYKSLNNISYSEIAKCFNLAFSDYYLQLQLTAKQLQTHFEISGVDKNLSYGAFVENQMIGFIFNSSTIYNEQIVVFDVGTGVIPEHRGKKVFTTLFRFTEQELQKHQIEKYYLEVLQQNDKAISSYRKQGFTVTREFSILSISNYNEEIEHKEVKYINFTDFDLKKISPCNYVKPSYEHSTNILKINPNLYEVAFTQDNNTICAFSVFSKEDGRIIQLGYTDINQLKLVIEQLLSKFNNITVKNIDVVYLEVLKLLHSLGFCEVCQQFEMVKTISST